MNIHKRLSLTAAQAAPRAGCRGSVLAVGMLFLLIITLLGLITTMHARTEARLAGNNHDRYLAFQAAEAALREAESLLDNTASPPVFGTIGLYFAGDTAPSALELDATNSLSYSKTIDEVAAQPRYIIEQIGLSADLGSSVVLGNKYYDVEHVVYRISALGIGRSDGTHIALQTTYRR